MSSAVGYQPLGQRHHGADLGNPVTAALFAGAVLVAIFCHAPALSSRSLQFDATALGKQGGDDIHSQLHRLLDGKFHLIATADHLSQMDKQGRLHLFSFCSSAQGHHYLLLAHLADGGRVLAALPSNSTSASPALMRSTRPTWLAPSSLRASWAPGLRGGFKDPGNTHQ